MCVCVIRGRSEKGSNYCSVFVLPNHVPPTPSFPDQSFPPNPPTPPKLNHMLVFLDELPQVLILLFGIMSLHAGLDMASPGRELPLHIRGSSGLLICAAERDLRGRFKCKKITSKLTKTY